MPEYDTVMDGDIVHPKGCPRGLTDCSPLARRASEGHASFFCCGENDGTHPGPDQDRWRYCSKSEYGADVLVNVDERDMIEMAVVLLEALSSEANRAASGTPFFAHLLDEEGAGES